MPITDNETQTAVTREIADLIVADDRELDKFFHRSILCLAVVSICVAGLFADILFLEFDTPLGKIVYYASLGLTLISLLVYLAIYGLHFTNSGVIKMKLAEARKKLETCQKLEELKEKIRQRIERMKSEIAWFTSMQNPGALDNMDKDRSSERGNEEFEYFVRKFFEKLGFRVEKTVVTENGVYIQMIKDDKRYIIFPIHPPQQVGHETIKEINRDLMSTNIEYAVVVTSGSYTDKAREYVGKRNVILYDRTAILDGLKGIIGALVKRIEEEQKLLTESDAQVIFAAFSDTPSSGKSAQSKPAAK